MDLQNIQDQLNTEFAKSETRIIFWFDDKGEYEDEVSELQLGDAKLHILDGTNWLYSKYLLNEEDKESKYLVYAAFAKPSDAENPLADMYYYSTPYYTDRVSQMSQEIGIDNRFKEHLSQYGNFWKNKHRIEKFKELGIDHYNAQTIDIGLISVLTDVKTPNFEEVVKQMMFGDNEKYCKALDDNGLTDKFWELCEKFFGYKAEKPNIDDLSACMILTYASSTLKATVPEAMRTYILKVTNLITYFDFIQTEKVTDTMKARSIVAYFTTEDGEKISFDVLMIANSREDAPEKRTFHEKFTLKSREYKYGDKYYLVLADANDEKNILQQYEFMIDIAFVDDFGF